MISAEVFHRIPFHDVDILHVAWHGHYYKYFELARTELAKKLGIDWPMLKELGFAMPVISSQARYEKVIRYDEVIKIKAQIEDPMLAAFVVTYTITSQDESVIYATGMTKQVYVSMPDVQIWFALPDVISERLKECID